MTEIDIIAWGIVKGFLAIGGLITIIACMVALFNKLGTGK